MDFYKYHALGNDYIVIDPNKIKIDLSIDNIKLICHRHRGVGSDGILYGPISAEGRICLKIFNPDGSEAEKSGNGIRIFARYLIDADYVKSKEFSIDTSGGKAAVEILDKKGELIKVDMGPVTYQSELIPVNGKGREVVNEDIEVNGEVFKVTCVSIGNPHCVIPLDSISKDLVVRMGPFIENHSLFPNRINLQLLKVIDRNNIQIEIWERGAGYTLASGSSSCAAASAANKLGLVDNLIKVHSPGGAIDIEIKEDGRVFMTGSVSSIAKGEFSKELREKLNKEKEL
ncbi:MAG: diaminopimelate epimerase [Candidatus Omnitrophota bacterium]